MREEAEEQESGNVGDGACAADVLRRAADALEAARVKTDELRTDLDQLAEHDQAVGDELTRVINERAVPKGWRLVPEEPTGEMITAGQSWIEPSTAAPSDVYHAMLAAAPEISDDR